MLLQRRVHYHHAAPYAHTLNAAMNAQTSLKSYGVGSRNRFIAATAANSPDAAMYDNMSKAVR